MPDGKSRRSRNHGSTSRRTLAGALALGLVAVIAVPLVALAVTRTAPPVAEAGQVAGAGGFVVPTRTPPPMPDQLQPADVMPRLDDEARPFNIVMFGDSTGVSRTGWHVAFADWLGKTYDRPAVIHPWDGTPGAERYAPSDWAITDGDNAQIDIYNASVSSTEASYPMTRLDAMVPIPGETVDMVMVNYGHNHTDSNLIQEGPALIAKATELYPNAAVVAFLQNSERADSPHANMLHVANDLWRGWLNYRNYTVVDIETAFDEAPDLNAILSDDGDIHPNEAGYLLWADTLIASLKAASPAP
jgi:hypothetical protein